MYYSVPMLDKQNAKYDANNPLRSKALFISSRSCSAKEGRCDIIGSKFDCSADDDGCNILAGGGA